MPAIISLFLLVFALHFSQSTTRPVEELKSRATLREHVATIRALALGSDGVTLASGDEAGAIIIWDIKLHKKIRAFNSPKKIAVLTLSMSADCQTLISAHADNIVRIWEIKSGEMLRQIHVDSLTAARITPAGDTLICTRGTLPDNADELSHVLLIDPKTGKKLGAIDADFEFIVDAAIAPDGKTIAVSGGESLTEMPASQGGRQRCRIDLYEFSRAKNSASAKLLRAVGENIPQPLLSPTFSGGGKLIAAVAGDWRIFETAGGKQVADLKSPEFRARSCAISRSVRWIATGAIDSTVILFDTHDWQASFQSQADPSLDVNAMCFSPDGSTLVASRGRLIELFLVPER